MLSDTVIQRARGRVGSSVVGKYLLDGLLGIGGMAAVYAATHRNGSRVALKILHHELSRDQDLRTRFLREGYVANKVGHAGVVRVLDDEVDADGCALLVMELLEGETLDARWERAGKRMALDDVASIAVRVLDVLSSAHDAGIVHRDMKPENVFLTYGGDVKVMDFGIARVMGGSGRTKSGDLMGTPAFMPPEQAAGRNKDIDARTDVWSVGAMMFTLLSGCNVHEGRSGQEQMIYAATTPARSIARVMPALPDDVVRVVDTALSFDREQRWQSARAMQNVLRSAVPGAGAGERAGARTSSVHPERATQPEVRPGTPTIKVGSMSGQSGETLHIPAPAPKGKP